MNKTPIDWVRNPDGTQGYTWNPITGCLNGCEYCYARKLANGRLKSRYLANKNWAPPIQGNVLLPNLGVEMNPFYPRFWEDRLGDIPHDWTTLAGKQHVKPRGIFVCDMSDLFGIGIPPVWTAKVWNVMKMSPQHRFYLLTKQPSQLIKFSPFPDNCWVGVTVTHWETLPDAFYWLSKIQATVTYISFEPLLEFIPIDGLNLAKHRIGQVIIGAQTKPTVYPKIEWVEEISKACVNAGIPLFLKDNLRPLLVPKHIVLRQEMPCQKPQ